VKSLARITIFFSVFFILSFFLAGAARFLQVWIEAAQVIPAKPIRIIDALISSGWRALPAAVYVALLGTISYTTRKNMPALLSIILLLILSMGFSLGLSLGMLKAKNLSFSSGLAVPRTLGKPGLILSQGETAIVLLEDPATPNGARVVSIPGRPLMFQPVPIGSENTTISLPPAPFHTRTPYFITSLILDFALIADQLIHRLERGLFPLIIYLGSLCLLLVSLRFVFKFSSWPLANFFLGVLVFRGILAFQIFLDSEEIQTFLSYLLGGIIPRDIRSPAILTGIALLVLLYTFLMYAAREKRKLHG
jgi:hypothetical protein